MFILGMVLEVLLIGLMLILKISEEVSGNPSPLVSFQGCSTSTATVECVDQTFGAGVGLLRGSRHVGASCVPTAINSSPFGPIANTTSFTIEIWMSTSTIPSNPVFTNPILEISTPFVGTGTNISISLDPRDVQVYVALDGVNLTEFDPQNTNYINAFRAKLGTLKDKGGACELTDGFVFCVGGSDNFFTRLMTFTQNTNELLRFFISVEADTITYMYTLGADDPTVEYAYGCYDFVAALNGIKHRKRYIPENSVMRLGCSNLPLSAVGGGAPRIPASSFVYYKAAIYQEALTVDQVTNLLGVIV